LAAGAELYIGTGAMAGSTASTANIGQTSLQGENNGTILDFSAVTTSNNIKNESAAVASASTLTAAEDAAVNALGAAGVAYFTFGDKEYFVATNHAETSIGQHDAVVCLIGAGFSTVDQFWGTSSSGLVTLHKV
jgi:hypothetical protein